MPENEELQTVYVDRFKVKHGDKEVFAKLKPNSSQTYLRGTYDSATTQITTDNAFKYIASTKSANVTIYNDVIVINGVENDSQPSKLTINVNEQISFKNTNDEILYAGWLYNAVSLYQGTLSSETPTVDEDGNITNIDSWNKIWTSSCYYASECAMSEVTFGYTVLNGTKSCCYKVVYDGDNTANISSDSQASESSPTIKSDITIVSNEDSITTGGGTDPELAIRVEKLESELDSKSITSIPLGSINDLTYLQNNGSTLHLTMFKPDINFNFSTSTTIRCFINRIDNVPENAKLTFVIYKLNSAKDGLDLIAKTNTLSQSEIAQHTSNSEIKTIFTTFNKDALYTDETYYVGVIFNFGTILTAGNSISSTLNNFKPFLTYTKDNLQTAEPTESVAIDGSGRMSTYRVFYELKNG